MKLLITTALILIALLGTAQDFIYDKVGLTDYSVIESEGSASELYTKVIYWIKDSYETPEDVIIAEFENKKVRIQGYAVDYTCKSGVCSSATYIIEISTKDDKLKFDPISMSSKSDAKFKSLDLNLNDGSDYYKKSGELRPYYIDFVRDLADVFNRLSSSLTDSLSGNEEGDDEW